MDTFNDVTSRMTHLEFVVLLNKRLSGRFCRHCKYKASHNKGVYCVLQPSNNSKYGFRLIRGYDDACGHYIQREV